MYLKMINKYAMAKILFSLLSAIVGLSYCSTMLYRQFEESGFLNIAIMAFIYFLLPFSIGIFLLNYLSDRISVIETALSNICSKKGVFFILTTALCFLAIPIGNFLFEEFFFSNWSIDFFLVIAA